MGVDIHATKSSSCKNITETEGIWRVFIEIIPSVVFYFNVLKRLLHQLSVHRPPKCECKTSEADWETYVECEFLPVDTFSLDLSDLKDRDDLKKKLIEKTRESKRICGNCKKELIQNITLS
jgi:hypothetical protein